MDFNVALMLCAAATVTIWIVTSIVVMHQLSKRNIKINFLLSRLLIPKYVHQYKGITLKEEGKAGFLFYLWVVSINLALILVICALIF